MPDLRSHDPRKLLAFTAGDKLTNLDTSSTPGYPGEEAGSDEIQQECNERYAELQEMLYANGKAGDNRSVLLVLQGMDTAGKGGIVKHVVGATGPMGLRYTSFGVPTEEERKHHYLWRVWRALPPAGHIGVFDRSHYEDVLIVRVHNLVPPEVWGGRYDEINAFEKQLVDGGTALVKVALIISRDEQKRRLMQRLERPDKYWKYNPKDVDERKLWPAYQAAYQAMLDKTSTPYAPWYAVPADRKWYSRLAVTHLLIDALHGMDLSWPLPDFDVEAEKKRLAQS